MFFVISISLSPFTYVFTLPKSSIHVIVFVSGLYVPPAILDTLSSIAYGK